MATTTYLKGGIACMSGRGVIFLSDVPNFGYVEFKKNGFMVPKGALFYYSKIEYITFKDATDGKVQENSSAYLHETQPLSPSDLTGTIERQSGSGGTIRLSKYGAQLDYEANDLVDDLKGKNIVGKTVTFQNVRLNSFLVFATKIQLTTQAAEASAYLAGVICLDSDTSTMTLGVFYNGEELAATYSVSGNATFTENQVVLVKIEKEAHRITVKEIQSTGRRKGTIQKIENSFCHLIDESSTPIVFRHQQATYKSGSSAQMAAGKVISYELEYDDSLKPCNIQVES